VIDTQRASSPVFLQELGVVCAAGQGQAAVADALFADDGPRGVAVNDALFPGRPLALGTVTVALPTLEDRPLRLRGRNNALLAVALAEIRPAVDAAIARFGAGRVAIVLGTSTSGIGESELAQRHFEAHGAWPAGFHYAQQEMGTPAEFLAAELGTCGPAYVISTACSSSAKALAAGARLIQAGLADAVVAGGADSLCRFTVAGFSSLESVSAERCNPFSANRHGINIGEGAALFLLGRDAAPVRLAGWGESADAHHMSAPEPSGRAPRQAVDQALARAGIAASDLAYLNLHGTATPQNDAMEATLVAGFADDLPCSSTKPLTGHTLGAAGAIEAALCWLTLARNPGRRLPPHWWDGVVDPALAPLHLVRPGETFAAPPRYVLTQNFAFGGSNAALVLGAG
jgi:3-oxoacyl-[acyl-carrier-protein] synthase-1